MVHNTKAQPNARWVNLLAGLSDTARETVRKAYAGEPVSARKWLAIAEVAEAHGHALPAPRVPTRDEVERHVKRLAKTAARRERDAERAEVCTKHETALRLPPGAIKRAERAKALASSETTDIDPLDTLLPSVVRTLKMAGYSAEKIAEIARAEEAKHGRSGR